MGMERERKVQFKEKISKEKKRKRREKEGMRVFLGKLKRKR